MRPFFLTRGRTWSDLPVEAMVQAARPPGQPRRAGAPMRAGDRPLPPEYAGILQLCAVPRAVAEVAARMRLPLGVARVLVGDLARAGMVSVGARASGDIDLALLDRLISGVERL